MIKKIIDPGKFPLNFLLPLCLAFAALFIAAFIPVEDNSLKMAGDYYTLICPRGSSSAVSEALEKNGIEYLSAVNTLVDYNDYIDMKKISVAVLEERFIAEDRRFDPYLKSLIRMFRAGSDEQQYDVVYIKAKNSPFLTYINLKKTLSSLNIEWNLYGYSPYSLIVYLASVIFIIAALTVLSDRRKVAGFIFALPLLVSAFVTGPAVFWTVLFCLVLYFFFSISAICQYETDFFYGFRSEFKRKSFKYIFIAAMPLFVIISGIVLNQNGFYYLFFFMLILYWLLSYLAVLNYSINKVSLSRHLPFSPVSILGKPRRSSFSWKKAVPAVVMVLFPLVILFSYEGANEVPMYKASASLDSREDVQQLGDEELLPNFEMFAAHVVYQKNFMDINEWGMPETGREFSRESYSLENDEIKKVNTNFYIFTEDEYNNIIKMFRNGTLYKSLTVGGKAGKGSYVKNAAVMRNAVSLVIVFILATVFSIFIWLGLNSYIVQNIFKKIFYSGKNKENGQKA